MQRNSGIWKNHKKELSEHKPMAAETNEVCEICGKSRGNHTVEETQNCAKDLVEMGIMRFCGLCGVTKPAEGLRDRCSKCGEKYSFVNR